MDVRPEERDIGRARERGLPRQRLVEDAAERVDVRALVQGVTGDLLRCDVLERANDLARDRHTREGAGALREAEVAEVAVLAAGSLRDEDVRGLDIAVHETLLVGGVERLGNLREEVDGALRLQCSVLGDDLRQIGSFDVAHREEEDAVLLPRLVDRDDVRMVERRRDP